MQATSREKRGAPLPIACKGEQERQGAGNAGLWQGRGEPCSPPVLAEPKSATVNQPSTFFILLFSLLEQDRSYTNRASLTLSGTSVLMRKDADARVVLQVWANLGTSY